MTDNDPVRPPTGELADAITRCLEFCDNHPGYNLPDLLSAALMQAAYQQGGSWALVRHRPGCWEATHVQALAAGADYQLQHDHEQEY